MGFGLRSGLALAVGALWLMLIGTLLVAPETARAQIDPCRWPLQYATVTPHDYVYTSGTTCSDFPTGWTWHNWGRTQAQYWDASWATQYYIGTSVYGYDRCGGDPWQLQTGDFKYRYNDHWSGEASDTGGFLDCTPLKPHQYLVYSWHYRQLTSTSPSYQWRSPDYIY